MKLSYRTRKRLALAVLVLAMPAWIGSAWFVMSLIERPSIWVEFAIYVALGVVWVLPFKGIFKGIGQADPDAGTPSDDPGH